MRGVLAVILGLAIATPAFADWMDGNRLMSLCSNENDSDVGICYGYIEGVLDVVPFASVCIPDGAILGQLKDVFMKAMRDNPEIRHRNASVLLSGAFKKAYCN